MGSVVLLEHANSLRFPSLAAESDLLYACVSLSGEDFDSALAQARAAYSATIGAPKIPNVTWDDVGGLSHVKSDILDTIQLPLEHPELFSDGLKKRSGMMAIFCPSLRVFMKARDPIIRSSRHWQNSFGKSSGYIMFLELLFCEGPRVNQHVHR